MAASKNCPGSWTRLTHYREEGRIGCLVSKGCEQLLEELWVWTIAPCLIQIPDPCFVSESHARLCFSLLVGTFSYTCNSLAFTSTPPAHNKDTSSYLYLGILIIVSPLEHLGASLATLQLSIYTLDLCPSEYKSPGGLESRSVTACAGNTEYPVN